MFVSNFFEKNLKNIHWLSDSVLKPHATRWHSHRHSFLFDTNSLSFRPLCLFHFVWWNRCQCLHTTTGHIWSHQTPKSWNCIYRLSVTTRKKTYERSPFCHLHRKHTGSTCASSNLIGWPAEDFSYPIPNNTGLQWTIGHFCRSTRVSSRQFLPKSEHWSIYSNHLRSHVSARSYRYLDYWLVLRISSDLWVYLVAS